MTTSDNYSKRFDQVENYVQQRENKATWRGFFFGVIVTFVMVLTFWLFISAASNDDAGAAELDPAVDWHYITEQVNATLSDIDWMLQFIGADEPIELTLGEWGMRLCESSHDYTAISPSGTYRGAYQFEFFVDDPSSSNSTWNWVISQTPYAHWHGVDLGTAPRKVQDVAARTLLTMPGGGAGHWPICGQRLTRDDLSAILDWAAGR